MAAWWYTYYLIIIILYYFLFFLIAFIEVKGLEKHIRDTKVYIINITFILFLHVQS